MTGRNVWEDIRQALVEQATWIREPFVAKRNLVNAVGREVALIDRAAVVAEIQAEALYQETATAMVSAAVQARLRRSLDGLEASLLGGDT